MIFHPRLEEPLKDCTNNNVEKDEAGNAVSALGPISMEPLESNKAFKLSDGYCYSTEELAEFQKHDTKLSPLTRQPFSDADRRTIELYSELRPKVPTDLRRVVQPIHRYDGDYDHDTEIAPSPISLREYLRKTDRERDEWDSRFRDPATGSFLEFPVHGQAFSSGMTHLLRNGRDEEFLEALGYDPEEFLRGGRRRKNSRTRRFTRRNRKARKTMRGGRRRQRRQRK